MEDGELVASEPRRDRALARDHPEARGDLAQEVIADRMPERVVHELEAIKVDQQDAEAGPPIPARGGMRLDQVVEPRAVRQAGERVGEGQAADLGFRAQPLALIADRDDDLPFAAERHRSAQHADGNQLAVGGCELGVPFLALRQFRDVDPGQQRPERATRELAGGDARERLQALVGRRDHVAVADGESLERQAGELAQAGAVPPCRRLRRQREAQPEKGQRQQPQRDAGHDRRDEARRNRSDRQGAGRIEHEPRGRHPAEVKNGDGGDQQRRPEFADGALAFAGHDHRGAEHQEADDDRRHDERPVPDDVAGGDIGRLAQVVERRDAHAEPGPGGEAAKPATPADGEPDAGADAHDRGQQGHGREQGIEAEAHPRVEGEQPDHGRRPGGAARRGDAGRAPSEPGATAHAAGMRGDGRRRVDPDGAHESRHDQQPVIVRIADAGKDGMHSGSTMEPSDQPLSNSVRATCKSTGGGAGSQFRIPVRERDRAGRRRRRRRSRRARSAVPPPS